MRETSDAKQDHKTFTNSVRHHKHCILSTLSNLGRILISQIGDLTVHDGREGIQLIHEDQIFERPRSEEERVTFLQRHGRGELRLVVVVAQMSNLIQEMIAKFRRHE